MIVRKWRSAILESTFWFMHNIWVYFDFHPVLSYMSLFIFGQQWNNNVSMAQRNKLHQVLEFSVGFDLFMVLVDNKKNTPPALSPN